MRLDAVIFGGGVAGLWLLDRLSRQGCHAVLLEAGELGAGQTVASQGIIHGGLKYTLQGLLTPSAKSIRGMPVVWRDALLGRGTPNLTRTRVRSECCYLWQTDSLSSRMGMIGARVGLQVKPESLTVEDRPDALKQVPGQVARLAEQVLCPRSLLADLAEQYRDRILKIDVAQGLQFRLQSPGEISQVELTDVASGQKLQLIPRQVVFTAGAGNASLRKLAKLDDAVMQRRPLQMVLVRGELPALTGHCVDGAKTRVTVTSDLDSCGRMVWQIGGQLAEDGVTLSPTELTRRAQEELQAVLPGVSFLHTEWSTYRTDRAEGVTSHGTRPETVQVLCAGNVTTGWPTKLALAPVLANEIASRISAEASTSPFQSQLWAKWPRPIVAALPWEETQRQWWPHPQSTTTTPSQRRAA